MNLDSKGVPTLKALYKGVVVDPQSAEANRHLRRAALPFKLHLELVEVPADIDEDDEDWDDEDDEDWDDEDDEDWDDEDEDELCENYPAGCDTCRESVCCGPAEDQSEDDALAVDLKVKRYKGRELSYDEISCHPALCRFLNQISDTHQL